MPNPIITRVLGGLSLVQQAIAILRSKGAGANAYIFGIGTINGLTAGNFLDSAGTTAATVDDPLGLDLDAMGVVGPELIANGGPFTVTTGWATNNVTQSIASGELKLVATTADKCGSIYAIACTSGKTYRIVASIRSDAGNVVAKSARIRVTDAASFGGSVLLGPQIVSANGVQTVVSAVFVANASAEYVECGIASNVAYGNIGDIAYLTSVSVKEISGIHPSQATTANKPKLRKVGSVYYGEFDATDLLTMTFPAGYVAATIIDAVYPTGQVTLSGQNIVGTYNIFGGVSSTEFVTNGFTDIATTSSSIVGGKLRVVGGTNGTYSNYSIATVVGATYRLQFTAEVVSPGTYFVVSKSSTNGGGSNLLLVEGTTTIANRSAVFVATTTAECLFIACSGTWDFSNISVQQVMPSTSGRIILKDAPTAGELATLQRFANLLAGV